jgi:hypothetical protein
LLAASIMVFSSSNAGYARNPNSKSEYRNPKQIRIIERNELITSLLWPSAIRVLILFRISRFEFRIC